jgi:hypothetical protein
MRGDRHKKGGLEHCQMLYIINLVEYLVDLRRCEKVRNLVSPFEMWEFYILP